MPEPTHCVMTGGLSWCHVWLHRAFTWRLSVGALAAFAFGEGGRVSRLFDGRRIVSSHGNDRVGCNSIIYITIYVYVSYGLTEELVAVF